MGDTHFDDDKYFERLFEREGDCDECTRHKAALETSHDVRKFEIGLFWTRGSYYWVFIAASLAAYFAVANKFIGDCSTLYDSLVSLDFMEKIVLLILSSVSFLFSLSWVLVNKGSKFWQKNWETHIDRLEDEITGKLYKTILNTHDSVFSNCPLSKKAYDYSVSKVTTSTSIMLTVLTFSLAVFHFAIIFIKNFSPCEIKTLILLLVFGFIVWRVADLLHCTGNGENKCGSGKWFMRSESLERC